jgi:hypothetical protein
VWLYKVGCPVRAVCYMALRGPHPLAEGVLFPLPPPCSSQPCLCLPVPVLPTRHSYYHALRVCVYSPTSTTSVVTVTVTASLGRYPLFAPHVVTCRVSCSVWCDTSYIIRGPPLHENCPPLRMCEK